MKLSAKILLCFLLSCAGLLDAASSTNQPLVVNTNSGRLANFTNFFAANTNLSVPAHAAFFAPLGSSGLTSLNALTGTNQTFATGAAGTDFAISSVGTTHTFNLPTAAALTRGLLSGADWTTFNSKANASHTHAAADITSGTIDPARLGSGSAITTKYLRGDSTWQTVSGGGGDALVANPLSQFAATTSAQLRGVISDETGSGAAVFADSPSLITPTATTLSVSSNGTASSPSFVFSGRGANWGLYSPTASSVGFSIGGSMGHQFWSDGSLYLQNNNALFSLGASSDVTLTRDAANTLAQRNGTTAQTFRLYNTYTDASNYDYLQLSHAGGQAVISTFGAGTGVASSHLTLKAGGSSKSIIFNAGGLDRWGITSGGNLVAQADNVYDIGASGATRPRTGYFGTSVVTPVATVSNLTLTGAISFPAGTRQTFAPNTTTPGINVGSVASDPSTPSNGDLWLNTTTGRMRTRVGGASVDVATGATQDFELTTITSGATIAIDLNATQYQTLALATDATTVTTSNRSASKGRATTIFVLASGAQRTLTLNASWRNFNGGSTSVVIPSGKEASISLFCTGSAETDVRVVYTIQP